MTPNLRAAANAKSIVEDISQPLIVAQGDWSDPIPYFKVQLRVDPSLAYEMTFSIPGDALPSLARQVTAFVNGRQCGVTASRTKDWNLVLPISTAILDGHFVHSVDVVLPEPTAIRFGQVIPVALHRTARPSKTAFASPKVVDETEPASQVVREANAASVVSSQPLAAPTRVPDPAGDLAAPAPAPFATARHAFGTAKLAELRNIGAISILTLELIDAMLGGVPMLPFYLKIIRENSFFALELRERDGAFQLFDRFPVGMTASDDFGNHMTLFVDPQGMAMQHLPGLKGMGTAKLEELLLCLPEAITVVAKVDARLTEDGTVWSDVARTIGQSLLTMLK